MPTLTLLAKCYLQCEMYSMNHFTSGAHWSAKNRHWRHTKQIWVPLLRSEQGLGSVIAHADQRRHVRIERWLDKGQREWDVQNFGGGSAKSVVDALTRLGWLKDDSPKWIELEQEQRKFADLTSDEQDLWHAGVRTVVEVAKIDG